MCVLIIFLLLDISYMYVMYFNLLFGPSPAAYLLKVPQLRMGSAEPLLHLCQNCGLCGSVQTDNQSCLGFMGPMAVSCSEDTSQHVSPSSASDFPSAPSSAMSPEPRGGDRVICMPHFGLSPRCQ